MNDVFPAISEVSLATAEPGSLVKITRYDGPKLALITDQVVEGQRSFVWLNANFASKPAVMYAEKWQIEGPCMCFNGAVRFELKLADEFVDPTGRKAWETAGAIVLIGKELFIRAAPSESFYGKYTLVNIRNGAVYLDHLPSTPWTFLSWKLWLRDPANHCNLLLTEFDGSMRREN